MKEEDEVMDLTQDDCDSDIINIPAIALDEDQSSSNTEPYNLSPRNLPEPIPESSKGKGKGKGKGKRTSVGSLNPPVNKQTKTDNQAATQQQAAEKAAKKAALEMNKIYKPGECMKYMIIEMHPSLSSAWYMSDVGREAAAAGARVAAAPALCDPGLVMWSRAVPPRLATGGGQLALTSPTEPCKRALYVTQASDAQEHVAAHTLAHHVGQIKDLVDCELTVVLFGVKEFFKSSSRKTANSNRKLMTEIDLEMAITDLLVSAGCDTVVVNSASELALLVVQFTKAIAEAPFKKAKKACEEQAEFYMKGDNKNCIGVDKDGNGLARLWQQMIAVLPHSSLEVSRAVCGQYKSPLALQEALRSRDSIHQLAELGVSRAGGGGARARRLGPEQARKMHALFTEERGDVLLEYLLVSAGCDTVVVNSASELALLVVQFTKAIAEAPFKKAKKACEEQAEFYMKGDNKNCIGVDKDGNGLARLWQQMIAVLPHSSLEVSRAVCGQYKSPLALQEALRSRDSIHQLAELGVSRAGGGGARARRLGPEQARKMHALFTEERGDVLLE